jgi:hypothetical protein
MPKEESRPENNPGAAHQLTATDSTVATDIFRRSWQRRLWLPCGRCTEICRCQHKDNPTPLRVDGYLAAVEHLDKHGLPAAPLMAEARQLWKRGGSDRAVADRVVRRWTA